MDWQRKTEEETSGVDYSGWGIIRTLGKEGEVMDRWWVIESGAGDVMKRYTRGSKT